VAGISCSAEPGVQQVPCGKAFTPAIVSISDKSEQVHAEEVSFVVGLVANDIGSILVRQASDSLSWLAIATSLPPPTDLVIVLQHFLI